MRIKKNDTVYVLTGVDRGKTGRVLVVDVEKNTCLVEGVNRRKRHQRPTQRNPKGGIVTKEAPIHLSNVAIWVSGLSKPSRLSAKLINDGGKVRRIRIAQKTGEEV